MLLLHKQYSNYSVRDSLIQPKHSGEDRKPFNTEGRRALFRARLLMWFGSDRCITRRGIDVPDSVSCKFI